MKKKTIAVLMTVVMALTIVPSAVFADDLDGLPNQPTTGDKPKILIQPVKSAKFPRDGVAIPLYVKSDETSDTIQWCSCTISSKGNKTNKTRILGATESSYSPTLKVKGTYYYYAIVSNNNGSTETNVSQIEVVPKFPYNINFNKYSKVKKTSKYSVHRKGKQTIKTTKGTKFAFKTKFFLKTTLKKHNDASEIQGAACDGKYLYVVTRPHTAGYNSKVRIVKYTMNGKKKKVGPNINLGHGEALAYSPIHGTLFSITPKGPLLQINKKTLKIEKKYKSEAKGKNRMAIDGEGNFYFTLGYPRICMDVYTLKDGKLVPRFISGPIAKHYPGASLQNLGFDLKKNRLYMLSDNAFYSYPVDKVFNGTLQTSDIKWTILNSKRECEAIVFDKKGKALLLATTSPEVLSRRN